MINTHKEIMTFLQNNLEECISRGGSKEEINDIKREMWLEKSLYKEHLHRLEENKEINEIIENRKRKRKNIKSTKNNLIRLNTFQKRGKSPVYTLASSITEDIIDKEVYYFTN